MKFRESIVIVVSGLLICLFDYTGISKLHGWAPFRQVLSRLPFMPPGLAEFTGIAIIIAGLLFFPRTMIYGLYSSLFLLLAFTIYLFVSIAFAKDLPCQCGGIISALSWRQHLWLNISLIIMTLGAISLKRGIKSFSRKTS